MSARLVSTGSVIVDLPLSMPRLPERGGDVLGTAGVATPGGGFNLVAAAARQGADVVLLSPLGSGAQGALSAAVLAAEGVAVALAPVPGGDTGLCVTITEPDGERTFLTAPGVEAALTTAQLAAVPVLAGDVAYVSGYDLAYPSGPALAAWSASLPGGVRLVLDPGPLVGEIAAQVLDAVVRRADVLTLNEREVAILTGLAPTEEGEDDGDPSVAYGPLVAAARTRLTADALLLVRLGPRGCLVADAAGTTWVPAPRVDAVDSTGAGDAHTGVLAAALLDGLDAVAAVRRANAAAAITVTRHGPATSPTRAELDAALR